MNNHWAGTIQRYLDGQSNAEEITALQQELSEDADLRDLYLDYVNLDVALGAAAEKATLTGSEIGRTASFPPTRSRTSPQSWRWLAAAAACAALIAFFVRSKPRHSAPARPDIAATIASTQSAIARLSVEPAPSPASWTSPTASLLNPPVLLQWRQAEPVPKSQTPTPQPS